MEISKETRDYCALILKESSTLLNSLVEQPNITNEYHPQADALFWGDEYSESFSPYMKRVFIVLLQLRTRKILDSIDRVGLDTLELSRAIAPTWSFNCSARFTRELMQDFVDLRELFQSQSDSLIAKALGKNVTDI